jgi:hypothetical protein
MPCLLALQDGKVLSGDGQPEATAFWIHSRLHAGRPNSGAVFHTHQAEITALTCLEDFECAPTCPSVHACCMHAPAHLFICHRLACALPCYLGRILQTCRAKKPALQQQRDNLIICLNDQYRQISTGHLYACLTKI